MPFNDTLSYHKGYGGMLSSAAVGKGAKLEGGGTPPLPKQNRLMRTQITAEAYDR